MTRKSKRELERALDALTDDRPDVNEALRGVEFSDDLLDAIEAAAEHRLRNPDDPLPGEIVADLTPEVRDVIEGQGAL